MSIKRASYWLDLPNGIGKSYNRLPVPLQHYSLCELRPQNETSKPLTVLNNEMSHTNEGYTMVGIPPQYNQELAHLGL